MGVKHKRYDLFFRFIKTYLPVGFEGINRQDPILLELEEMMESGDQFFFIGDLIQVKSIYISEGCSRLLGINQDDFSQRHFFDIRHPDETDRHTHLRLQLFKTAYELYKDGKGERLLSSIFRMRYQENEYRDMLIQSYLFYSEIPYKTVFMLEVETLISNSHKTRHENHHYFGSDLSYFRYPDEKLIKTGCIFSKREFDVIHLLAKGLATDKIAEHLHLSPFTINTHRSNILQKTGKSSIPEVIAWLTDIGRI